MWYTVSIKITIYEGISEMRLDKYLADMGLGTRSEIKKEIKAGHVTVNGELIKDPGFNKVTSSDHVIYCGTEISYEEFVYYMLNKPAGVISASEDPREETVVDLIDERTRRDLFPCGRLDRDTEGLLLITNDGGLAHRLLSPKHHVDKTYYAVVAGEITEEDADLFREGLVLPDGLECMPAELVIVSQDEFDSPDPDDDTISTEILITIREGKFHQIKRMFEAIGSKVIYLKRLTMGPLTLDENLEPGEYRRLTDTELDSLMKL